MSTMPANAKTCFATYLRAFCSIHRCLCAFVWLVGYSMSFAGTFTITLNVVDTEKKPVSKAEAALFWDIKNGAMTARAKQEAVTDDTGKARLQVDDWDETRPVLVLSADRTLGG